MLSKFFTALLVVVLGVFYFNTYVSVHRGSYPMFHFNIPHGIVPENIPNLGNKVFVVTGANAGLGKATTYWLVANNAEVVMGCRSVDKCEVARQALVDKLKADKYWPRHGDTTDPATRMHCKALDLSSRESTKSFAEQVKAEFPVIDSLVLNAGIGFGKYSETKDGLERTFVVNHLGHFHLTEMLLDNVLAAPKSSIAVVTSTMHWMYDSVPATREQVNDESLGPKDLYSRSKLLNVVFFKELDKRLAGKEVYVNGAHPGMSGTDFIDTLRSNIEEDDWIPALVERVLTALMSIGWDKYTGSLAQVAAAIAPFNDNQQGANAKGKFFIPVGRLGEYHHIADDEAAREQLWTLSEELLGIKLL